MLSPIGVSQRLPVNLAVHLQVSLLLITIQLPPLPHELGEHTIIGPAVDTVVGLAVDTVVGLAVDTVIESSAHTRIKMSLHMRAQLV